MFFPGLTVISLVILLAVVLIFVGIEKIISGIFIQHKARWATVGLGVISNNSCFNCLSLPCRCNDIPDIPYGVRINV